MSRRNLILVPAAGFAVAFVAALTLQPVAGSFSKAYRFEGGAGAIAAAPERTATPESERPATLTPAPGRTPPANTLVTASPSSTRAPQTPTATTTPPPGRTATSTATTTVNVTRTATPSPAATASPTPDPCELVRDADLTLSPSVQTLRGTSRTQGRITLVNAGQQGHARDVVLRLTVVGGSDYLAGLRLTGQAPRLAPDAASLDLRAGDLGPGAKLELLIEADLVWNPTLPALSAADARPRVELRLEVMRESCGLRPATAAAVIYIEPSIVAVPVKPVAAVAVDGTLDSAR